MNKCSMDICLQYSYFIIMFSLFNLVHLYQLCGIYNSWPILTAVFFFLQTYHVENSLHLKSSRTEIIKQIMTFIPLSFFLQWLFCLVVHVKFSCRLVGFDLLKKSY